jgi:hypothetical protein
MAGIQGAGGLTDSGHGAPICRRCVAAQRGLFAAAGKVIFVQFRIDRDQRAADRPHASFGLGRRCDHD